MSERGGAVHVVTTRRRYKGREYATHLLRRSYREDGRVKNETLGNLSHLPDPLIDIVRRALRGEAFVPAAARLEIVRSRSHGKVQAVRLAMQRLGIESLIGSRPGPERERICALIAARIIAPHTKLTTTRWWHTTTLAEEFAVGQADEDDVYDAMDWLLEHQPAIERKLAARHLSEGSLALFDLSSSHFEGSQGHLRRPGFSRDGLKNGLQMTYGLLTNRLGCPVAVSVSPGNTADARSLMPQITKLRESLRLEHVVMVGDRGMISHKTMGELETWDGIAWITALKSGQIRSLLEGGALRFGLFDEHNLFEFTDPAYPDERLIAWRNAKHARLRSRKRHSLLGATALELDKIRERVARGKLQGDARIGVTIGRVLNKYKVARHFELTITESSVKYRMREHKIAAEAALDGICVIRTGLAKKKMSAPDAVRSYKSLAQVERAFRSLKTVDLKVRAIHHRLENRVRAHIFLCMLAYYVEWHLIETWRPLLFADEDQAAKASRDPVAPARGRAAANARTAIPQFEDDTPAHSLRTLLAELATLVRNTCRATDHPTTFEILTTPTLRQRRAFDLADQIPRPGGSPLSHHTR